MSLDQTIQTIKARASKKHTMALVGYLRDSLGANTEKQGPLDCARRYFINNSDAKGFSTIDTFVNKVATHQECLDEFEEGPAWRTFAISAIFRHNASLVLSTCLNYDKIENVIKAFSRKHYPIKVFNIIFPTETLKKQTIAETVALSFELKKCAKEEDCELFSVQQSARNILIGSSAEQDLFEGVIFVNIKCTAQEAEELTVVLEDLPGSPLIADQTLYAKDQQSKIHPVKLLICDVGPVWSLCQDSVHTVDVIRVASYLKKILSQGQVAPKNLTVSAAVYLNEHNTLNVKVAVMQQNIFIGGLDLINISYPEVFIEKLDSMLDSMDVSACIRSANLRMGSHVPSDNEYYTEAGWKIVA